MQNCKKKEIGRSYNAHVLLKGAAGCCARPSILPLHSDSIFIILQSLVTLSTQMITLQSQRLRLTSVMTTLE